MEWKIGFYDLPYDDNEIAAVTNVVKSRCLTLGPETESFEEEAADFLGRKHAIMVSSGTAAVHLALRALDIGLKDEVLVPALSHVCLANAVLYCGADPKFIDILHPENPTIDAESAANKLSDRTRAILPLHFAGFACQMSILKSLAGAKNGGVNGTNGNGMSGRLNSADLSSAVNIIEDASHALGGHDASGAALGTSGAAACFSFFAHHPLAAGNGGLIATDDDTLARRARLLRNNGISTPANGKGGASSDYDVTELGFDYRPSEITAALGRAQLRKIPKIVEWRRGLFEKYHNLLKEIDELTLPFANPENWGRPACHFLPILCRNPKMRDPLRKALQEAGIETVHHYRPVHTLKYFSTVALKAKPVLPQTEAFAAREISLPLNASMSEDDVRFVAESIKEILVKQ